MKIKDKFIEKFIVSQSLLDWNGLLMYCHVPTILLSLFKIDCSVLMLLLYATIIMVNKDLHN